MRSVLRQSRNILRFDVALSQLHHQALSFIQSLLDSSAVVFGHLCYDLFTSLARLAESGDRFVSNACLLPIHR